MRLRLRIEVYLHVHPCLWPMVIASLLVA